MSPVKEELCFLSHWALHVFWCAVCLRKMSIFKEKIHRGEGKRVDVCICVCLCGWKGKSQPVRIMNPNAVLSLEWSYVFSAIDTTTPCYASYDSPQSLAILIGSVQLFHQGSIERNFRTIGRTLDFLRQPVESCCSMMISCQKIPFE